MYIFVNCTDLSASGLISNTVHSARRVISPQRKRVWAPVADSATLVNKPYT